MNDVIETLQALVRIGIVFSSDAGFAEVAERFNLTTASEVIEDCIERLIYESEV